jgi:hypothetical protein
MARQMNARTFADVGTIDMGCPRTAGWGIDYPWIAQRVNWMWTAPLGCVVTFVLGYLVSVCLPNDRRPETTEPESSPA